jgi:hypothetical protein
LATSEMKNIEFGDPPLLVPKRRNIPYEIHGVAFVEGFKEPVSLVVNVDMRGIQVGMTGNFQAKEVYKFLREHFKKYSQEESGLSGSFSSLTCSWELVPEKWSEFLIEVEKAIGWGWANAFKTSAESREKQATS